MGGRDRALMANLAVININQNHYDLVPQAKKCLREAFAKSGPVLEKTRRARRLHDHHTDRGA